MISTVPGSGQCPCPRRRVPCCRSLQGRGDVAVQLGLLVAGCWLLSMASGGLSRGRKPGADSEQLDEHVEGVQSPFGGGRQIGLHNGEVDQALEGAPAAAALAWIFRRSATAGALSGVIRSLRPLPCQSTWAPGRPSQGDIPGAQEPGEPAQGRRLHLRVMALRLHQHHGDNLDDAGRALFATVGTVVTTHSGAHCRGDTVRGLAAGQTTRLEAPGRT